MSYPSGSFVPKTPSTSFLLIRSDKLVYATALIRPTGPCHPFTALAGPTLSYLRNPYPHVSGGLHVFYRRLQAGVGCSHGGFPDFGYLDPYRPQAPHQLFGVQGSSLCPTALGSNAPGPPGTWTRTDRKLDINCTELKAVVSALQHWVPVLQGHQVMIATDILTVVSYVNKKGGTHSPTLLCLTVELLLWLEAQIIIV